MTDTHTKIVSKVCLEAFKNTNKTFSVKFLSLIWFNKLLTKKVAQFRKDLAFITALNNLGSLRKMSLSFRENSFILQPRSVCMEMQLRRQTKAKLQNTQPLWSASLTCVGRLWRSRHNTIDAILIQWHVNEWPGILQLLPNKFTNTNLHQRYNVPIQGRKLIWVFDSVLWIPLFTCTFRYSLSAMSYALEFFFKLNKNFYSTLIIIYLRHVLTSIFTTSTTAESA